MTIRNVRAGDPLGGSIPASALIELDDAPYETLVIENVRPSRFGDIPNGTVLLNHPERVSRLVYPSSLFQPPHEAKRQLPALGDELHVSPFTDEVAVPGVDLAPGFKLHPDGPFYHRIIGTGTAELPLAADRRQGLEYHLMKVGGGNVVVKGIRDQNDHLQLINGSDYVRLTEDFAFVRLRPIKITTGPFAGHWRWEVVAQSPTGVTFI